MQSEKLMETLETRFGVPREFAMPLLPVLERVASQQPSSAEWSVVLSGVARAYRASRSDGDRGAEIDELCGLMSQFAGELGKLDESLKVLSVYLERVHQRLHPSLGSRLLH